MFTNLRSCVPEVQFASKVSLYFTLPVDSSSEAILLRNRRQGRDSPVANSISRHQSATDINPKRKKK